MWQNFWNLRVNEKLSQWKDFRHELGKLPLETAVVELNNMWSTAPIVKYNLPPENPSIWPDPWQLLAENYWCDVAKSLGIIYTIYFSSHKPQDIEMRTYYDYNAKERHTVVWLNKGKYIFNYWPYEIVNTKLVEEKELKLLYKYTRVDLKLDNY